MQNRHAFVAQFACALLLLLMVGPIAAQEPSSRTGEMAEAAAAFLESLDGDDRTRATFEFNDDERFNFHFIPRVRKGLPVKDMNLEQRRAAHALLASGLSSQGYLKATAIMELEHVLDMIEVTGSDRDREMYFVSVFGTPGGDEPWGWRYEGHHLSLNYTSATDEVVAVTPAFYGSNPGELRQGPRTGLRVLGAEEDVARRLMALLDANQRERAIIAETAPREIITAADREAHIASFEGLPASEMSAEQRRVLWELIGEYVNNVRADIAAEKMAKFRSIPVDSLFFAWAGTLERGRGHYYRVHGPTMLLEYDNTQNDANHVHVVWRDLEDDFGRDILREHYDAHAHD